MPNQKNKMELVLQKIVNIQQLLANIILVFMMSLITFDVIGRNFLNHPLKGTYELTEVSSALLVFFALAITHHKEDHITIDFLVERLSVKTRNLLNGLIEILIGIVLLLMSLHIYQNALRSMERNSTTTDLGLPVHPFLFLISFTLIVFMLTAIFKGINCFRLAVNKA
jgi:TRAP-type transport system small permease protein